MGATNDYFEIATDSGLFVKGRIVPPGTVGLQDRSEVRAVVESFKETGDGVDIQLSGGYRLSLPERRIISILTRDAA